MTLRVIFMGTPAFSVPTLTALHQAGHAIPAVYTQPPRASGRRGLALTPSPVQVEAERLGLPVRHPQRLRDPVDQAEFAALDADVAVVVAYGLLLPRPVLDAPRFGCLNGHASLLPRWRGAAPIQRAVEAGDAETGMMVMRMEAGLDTGPVALTERVSVGATETAGELHDRLAPLSARLMVEALARLEAGALAFEEQDAIAAHTGREAVYARKIDKSEAEIDWTQSAAAVRGRINGFSPFPGAWTTLDGGNGPERVKLLRAVEDAGGGAPGEILDDGLRIACGTGAVRLLDLQRAGGKPVTADAFLRGATVPGGARLGRTD
ncbi:methionyl-tRNA formyltransferase [Aurantimonas sp. MSK8Z-1]|uniref:methionyl-tRNA formyltransferase n=1 Tax=Mangrovibrevibacter kandeliae TaxID=2968473 RepID=UPI0021186CE4|nr:methionyl-tRNA formyltransferase [Aurantimonas sp. MSK8Z-1]MCW4116027.1 methionyl-tRNA formyltransferase [Aurantimonas sp. MSK8Z-1]